MMNMYFTAFSFCDRGRGVRLLLCRRTANLDIDTGISTRAEKFFRGTVSAFVPAATAALMLAL
jgi:hypothetical protein